MRRTIILLLIALLLPSASADFLAFGDQTITANQCDILTKTVTIQNIGTEQTSYSLSVDGDGSDFLTFSVIEFALNPGQAQTVATYYTIPCTARGTYEANLYFADEEQEKVIAQEIIVNAPDSINLTATTTSQVIEPCGTASYTLTLSNPLTSTEIYDIEASGHPDVHLSENKAVLVGPESKNIILSVTPEDCSQTGSFPLTVSISAEKSGLYKEAQFDFIIKSTDIPLLAPGISTIRTEYFDSTAELSIENTGDRTTTYSLLIEGADWASISPETVTLDPGQSQITALRLTPDAENVPVGRYPLTLTATVEQTGIRYSKDITVRVKPQTAFEKNPVPFIVAAVIVLAAVIGLILFIRHLKSPAFKVKYAAWKARRAQLRKEKAAKREQRRKEREAKREQKRKEREARRQALIKKKEQNRREAYQRKLEEQRRKQEKIAAEKARLKAQVEREFKKEYHLVSRKEAVRGKQKKNGTRIAALILGIIVLIVILAGFKVFAANLPYVITGIAILVVIFIAHKAARMTIVKAKWKLVPEGKTLVLKCWKSGLSQLGITATGPLKNFRIMAKKIRARIAPSPYVYSTIAIKTNVPADSTELKATFSVCKRWIRNRQLDSGDLRLGRYANQKWQTVPIVKSGEDKWCVHFTAEIGKTGTYCIYAKSSKKPQKQTHIIGYVIALAIIAAVAIAVAPKSQIIADGIPPQSWEQDTIHKIDLSKYFTDPDGDKLIFTATETSHVLIEIRGNTAFLTPDTGWTGEERVRFIADDGKEGKIASNSVKLQVKSSLIPASAQPYIALVLGILAIIFLLFTVRDLSRRSKK